MSSVLRLPYTPLKDGYGEIALRPMLPMTLYNQHKMINVEGLLDSGSDVSVLPYTIGVQLGTNWDELEPLQRLSGNLSQHEARGVIVNAQVSAYAPVRLAFAWTRAENVPVILGQVNFFWVFEVCFFRMDAAFEIRPRY